MITRVQSIQLAEQKITLKMAMRLMDRIRKNRSGWLVFGIVMCAASLVLPFKLITQEKIHSKTDLKFVNGQLNDFLFNIHRSSNYSFRLVGFPKRIHIDPDYRYLFDENAFTKLNYGDSITVGLSNKGYDHLYGKTRGRVVAYSINNSTSIFLNADKVIKNYNAPWPVYFSALLFIWGCYILYVVYKVYHQQNS